MKMKKVLAATAASMFALSAMSVVAFAETDGVASVTKVTMYDADGNVVATNGDGSTALMSKEGNASSAEIYEIDFSGLTEEQVGSITKIVADVTLTSDYVNGCIGGNVGGAWSGGDQLELSGSGSFTRTFTAGDLVAKDDDGNLAPVVQVQFWWVNPVPEEEPDDTSSDETPSDETPSNETPSDTTPDDTSKPNTDTGVAGVATVLGVAVLAAGAMVVAKKRK